MADVVLTWSANPVDEGVSGYVVYKNGTEVARPSTTTFTDPNVSPGNYTYEVAAVNGWGDGPKSDSVKTPPPASKPQNLVLVVKVQVQTP